MAKFNAANAVEGLEYDFTAFGGGAGTVPEPTTAQVEKFLRTVQDLARHLYEIQGAAQRKSTGIASPTDEELISAMTDEQAAEYRDSMFDATVAVTSGAITREDLDLLPYRVQAAFFAWISSELNPERDGTATRR